MRPVTALLCIGLCFPLAACLASATGDSVPGVSAAPAAAPAAAAAPAPEPAAAPMPAGRAATAPKPPARSAAAKNDGKDEWWKEGGVTREKINGMCWMKYETGRKDLPVEKRADLVNQCVIDTMKEYPPIN